MSGRLKAVRVGSGRRPCRSCACGRGLFVLLLWRGRRRCCPRGLGCLALLLGLAGAVLLLLRRRGSRDRFEPPREPRPGQRPLPTTQRVPSEIYRRPDPLIYSQTFLMGQGVAVTWDNPDIELERAGTTVSSYELEPATEYDVVARVWNASTEAPAVDLPVRFSYLEFGIGTVSHAIGEDRIDLPVKAAPGSPAFARMPWTTPATPGHYCLQVELIWPDDANPANNLGQENVDVKQLNSPRAAYIVPVRNDGDERRPFRFEVDAYEPGAPAPCPPDEPRRGPRERGVRRRRARARHARGGHPTPKGWTVALEPSDAVLAPGERIEVAVDVTAPDGFEGSQAFNVNAFTGDRLVGGVTLIAEGRA